MATRRWSIAKMDNEYQVTEAAGAAVATKEIELTIDLATVGSRENVLQALKKLHNRIVRGNWPPA